MARYNAATPLTVSSHEGDPMFRIAPSNGTTRNSPIIGRARKRRTTRLASNRTARVRSATRDASEDLRVCVTAMDRC